MMITSLRHFQSKDLRCRIKDESPSFLPLSNMFNTNLDYYCEDNDRQLLPDSDIDSGLLALFLAGDNGTSLSRPPFYNEWLEIQQ